MTSEIKIPRTEYDNLLIQLAAKDQQIADLKSQISIVYDVDGAAKVMGIGAALVRQLISKGMLSSLYLGKGQKILHSSIVEFLRRYEGFDLRNLDNIRKVS